MTASMATSGCSSDRFHNQVGCASDSECRSDRICEQNRCIAPSELDRTSGEDAEDRADADVGPDATPDMGPDTEPSRTTEEEDLALRALIGTWRTQVDATMRSPNGDESPMPVPSTLLIEIVHTQGLGISVEIDHSLICPLDASVSVGPRFVLTTRECRSGDENMSLHYSNIGGRAHLDSDGELVFNFTSNATFNGDGDTYTLDMTFEGPRID